MPHQVRRPRGHGLHRRRQPLRWRIRPRGSETVDPLRIRPSEANEESEAGRRTARDEMGNGRHENPSAHSTVRRERLRGRKAARPPEDLPDRRATPNAGHDPHRHIDLPRCSIEVRRSDGHRRRGPRFPGSHDHHGTWRPTSLVRHGLLSAAAPRERLPGHLEHSAATPPGMVPATRGNIGQGPLRLRLAGPRNPRLEGRDGRTPSPPAEAGHNRANPKPKRGKALPVRNGFGWKHGKPSSSRNPDDGARDMMASPNPSREVTTIAGGCFWCLQPIFQELRGVEKVEVGYSGGRLANPSYEAVCTDTTGHAEAVQITFDPQTIPLVDLLRIFFSVHDPTTLNRQGADSGTQYRSAIFYHSAEQKSAAEQVIANLESARIYDDPIVTQVVPAS